MFARINILFSYVCEFNSCLPAHEKKSSRCTFWRRADGKSAAAAAAARRCLKIGGGGVRKMSAAAARRDRRRALGATDWHKNASVRGI